MSYAFILPLVFMLALLGFGSMRRRDFVIPVSPELHMQQPATIADVRRNTDKIDDYQYDVDELIHDHLQRVGKALDHGG